MWRRWNPPCTSVVYLFLAKRRTWGAQPHDVLLTCFFTPQVYNLWFRLCTCGPLRCTSLFEPNTPSFSYSHRCANLRFDNHATWFKLNIQGSQTVSLRTSATVWRRLAKLNHNDIFALHLRCTAN